MQRDKKIWLELKEISPLLAETGLREPDFSVPSGYFENFAGELVKRIRNLDDLEAETMSLPAALQVTRKIQPYLVPGDYFEQFAEKLKARISSSEEGSVSGELEMISPLLNQLNRQMPYTTPPGYFGSLPEELSRNLEAMNKRVEEPEVLPSLLENLRNQRVHEVPSGYFAGLPDQILHKVKAQPKAARVVSFLNRNSWLKYAAAAVLTGLLVTIGVITFNRHTNEVLDPAAALARASDQEIVDFLSNQDILLSEKAGASTASNELSESDVRDLFNEIPDADLQQYVKDRSSGRDLITN